MSIIGLLVVLIVVGVGLYLVNQFITMDAKIKQLLNIVVIAALAIWIIVKFLAPLIK